MLCHMTVGDPWAFQHNRCQMFCLMTVGVLWTCQRNDCHFQKFCHITVAGFMGMLAQSLSTVLPHHSRLFSKWSDIPTFV